MAEGAACAAVAGDAFGRTSCASERSALRGLSASCLRPLRDAPAAAAHAAPSGMMVAVAMLFDVGFLKA